jgi:hypothetical protein
MRLTFSFLLVAGVLALAGCGGGSGSSGQGPANVTVAVTIKGGKPTGGIVHAKASKGDHVTLVVHSDVADEVHLHGYDLHKDVEAGGTARIAFTADITGSFEAELESRGLQILELTVQ